MPSYRCFFRSARRAFFELFRVPDAMLYFLSGILLSAAIDVATNGITSDGLNWHFNIKVTASIILMFLSSFFFTWMAMYLRPIEEVYMSHPRAVRKGNADKWYEVITETRGAIWVLIAFFLLSYGTMIISILLIYI